MAAIFLTALENDTERNLLKPLQNSSEGKREEGLDINCNTEPIVFRKWNSLI